MVDYTNMSEQERKDYVTGWMYIHNRKGKQNGRQKEQKESNEKAAAEAKAKAEKLGIGTTEYELIEIA